MIKFEVYFGMTMEGVLGPVEITEGSFRLFELDTIRRELNGYTLFDVWGVSNGIDERAKVLVLLASDANKTRGIVRSIAEAYKQQFKQQSVLVVESLCMGEFV